VQPPSESRGEPPPAEGSEPESIPGGASAGLLEEARLAVSAGDYQQAEGLLRRAQRIDSRNAAVYLALSQLYEVQGEAEQASRMAERGLLYCRAATCEQLHAQLQ